jgi:hypothetical protein
MVVMVDATRDGIEVTAVRVSKPQANWPSMELHCPYGNVSIVSSVCHTSGDPLGMLDSALDELRSQVSRFAPESEEQTAFVTYGSMSTQARLVTGGLRAALTRYGSEEGRDGDDWDGWDTNIPILSTGEDCASLGLAVLATSVHGRVRLAVIEKGRDGEEPHEGKIGGGCQGRAPLCSGRVIQLLRRC